MNQEEWAKTVQWVGVVAMYHRARRQVPYDAELGDLVGIYHDITTEPVEHAFRARTN